MDDKAQVDKICEQIENLKYDEIFVILLKIEKIVSERMAENETE